VVAQFDERQLFLDNPPVAASWSRRDFLAAASTLPFAVSGCRDSAPPLRFVREKFDRPASSAVMLLPAADYSKNLEDLIGRGFKELGVSLSGRRVLLKPNMVEYEPGTVINTNPVVVASAAAACRRAGAADVIVGEGPGHRRDIEYLLTSNGLGQHLRDEKIRFVDLNHDDARMRSLASGFMGLESLALPRSVLESDFVVSLPKLKTHHWAGMTCSMKNLFGTVPGAVYGWPKNILHMRGIDNAIVDLTATVRPQLAIVDAITCMEGDGPIMGTPRQLGFLAMGTDPVAVDATCARVIGLVPERLEYLSNAGGFLGHVDEPRISQRGEPISRYATQFEVVPLLAHLRRG
jgi:uncharacterized protein (DUF362 family)